MLHKFGHRWCYTTMNLAWIFPVRRGVRFRAGASKAMHDARNHVVKCLAGNQTLKISFHFVDLLESNGFERRGSLHIMPWIRKHGQQQEDIKKYQCSMLFSGKRCSISQAMNDTWTQPSENKTLRIQKEINMETSVRVSEIIKTFWCMLTQKWRLLVSDT